MKTLKKPDSTLANRPRNHVQPDSTFNLQPSTFNLQPSTFNLQPVTFNPSPSNSELQLPCKP
ncbi:hypothetical protein BJP36_36955 [Moorena producens JHB]|uniref:Restriction endonuclease n=1 Tax=Moorena producens (strain JHB) TaxID=1454205 RepID=A0A9Q9SU59_MOOP1|nr:hypothetical protein BJP36_36955 [Moorena producens JHB]